MDFQAAGCITAPVGTAEARRNACGVDAALSAVDAGRVLDKATKKAAETLLAAGYAYRAEANKCRVSQVLRSVRAREGTKQD